jgi:hypothetical protein
MERERHYLDMFYKMKEAQDPPKIKKDTIKH